MTTIPGSAYLGIGIFMSVFSIIVQRTTHKGVYWIFFVVGIVFVIIGIGKLLSKKENAASSVEPLKQQYAQQQSPQQSLQQEAINPRNMNFFQGQHDIHRGTHHPQHISVITCPACGTRHYDYAYYCMRCGTRMKK